MALGFFTDDNSGDSYESLQRKRKMADALLAQSQDGGKIESWTQGGAKLIQALSGSLQNRSLDAKERESSKAFNETLMRALGGSSPSMFSAPGPMPTGGGTPRAAAFSGSQGDFVSAMLPHAQKVAEETGLDPRLVIAQSALETGYGRSAPGNNFFGIKSHGQPGGQTLATTENVNGQNVATRDSFRAYGDMGESAKGYAEFLKANPRYREVLGAQGLDAQIEAMARSGYATDPMYGQKLRQIASGIQLPAQAPQQAPQQVAQAGMTPDGFPTSPIASDAPPMAYAPGQQAIAAAMPQTGPMPPPRPTDSAQQPAQGQRLTQAVTSPPIPAPQPTGNVQQAMMAVLSDPRFSPQQKSQAMQLYQMTQGKADYDFQVAGDQLYRINKRTGQAEPVAGASAAKPSDVQKQFAQAKQEGFQGNLLDFQKALGEARRPQTNVNVNNGGDNKFDDTLGTETAKLFIETAKEGPTARADVARVRQLRGLVETLPGGFLGGAEALASRYGIKLGPNASNIEAATAIINQLVPAQRPPGSGTMSDRDVDLFKSSLPNLSNTPQGNKIILDTMEAMAQYKAAQAAVSTDVVTKRITRDEGLRKLQELPDPFEAFKGFAGAQPLAPAPARAPAPSAFSDDDIQAEMKRRGLL